VQGCGRLGAVFPQQWFLGFHNDNAFHQSYSSFLQSQAWLHHNMACTMYLSLAMHIHMVNLAANSTRVEPEEHLEMPDEKT
jgi:hypothetical protein